jgi:hypothetical protein
VETRNTRDSVESIRHERFGTLPDRIQFKDMIEEKADAPNGTREVTYNPEGAWMFYSCLAADLGT